MAAVARAQRASTLPRHQRDDEFSPPDVNCHLTLPWGHATEGTISYPAVLHCGISNRPKSARGQAKAEQDATRRLQVEQEALDLSGINMRVATKPHVSDTSDTVL